VQLPPPTELTLFTQSGSGSLQLLIIVFVLLLSKRIRSLLCKLAFVYGPYIVYFFTVGLLAQKPPVVKLRVFTHPIIFKVAQIIRFDLFRTWFVYPTNPHRIALTH